MTNKDHPLIADTQDPGRLIFDESNLTEIMDILFYNNVLRGWYNNPRNGEPYGPAFSQTGRNIGEMLALVHSEISEALEGVRKSLQDDHLPHRTMLEVELIDAIYRILDLLGYLRVNDPSIDPQQTIKEKHDYNLNRPDHQFKNRQTAGGKAF